MNEVTLFGFPTSTFVNIARLALTEKGVPFDFVDLEPDMGRANHLALHPFNRVPILKHGEFIVYETAAIVAYVDSAFEGPRLIPMDPKGAASVAQWISAVNHYYYPYFSYHLAHERLVFPALGIEPDEKVVAAALPKVARALEVLERQMADRRQFILGDRHTLADFYMLPTLSSLQFTPEGSEILAASPNIIAWYARMNTLASVQAVSKMVEPFLARPVEHAREWVQSHRPRY